RQARHGFDMLAAMNRPESKAPETLAERFWSLARAAERDDDSNEPVAVVEHALRVLDELDAGKVGDSLTARTLNFLALLRQYEVKGDLLYASPEQARGEQMDERALVFSVGVLIFEKLTGRHPFGEVGNPERLARIRRGEMASGVNYFPIVPPGLRTVLVKAMGPFPEERWSSLLELRAQLERFVDQARNPQDYSGPTSAARPLPALPRESDPTRVMNRRSGAGPAAAVDLDRMARVSARQGAARLETQPAIPGQFSPSVMVGDISLQPKRKLGGIVLGMVAGAVVASLAFWLAWPRGGDRAAPATRGTAPAAGPGAAAGKAADPAGAAARPGSGAPTVTPAPVTGALGFDIQRGGQNAAAAARRCFASDRRVQFGASLLYDARTGRSRKIYFGSTATVKPPEKSCLVRNLIGLDAGGPPPRAGTVVQYAFHITPSAATAVGRLAPE
ncbi:MAG TPA: hypothetical protein VFU21_10620, partial [Kofleriaceae bacterium]|nr:hypothetical protein [Kofleriaceae bacterium]